MTVEFGRGMDMGCSESETAAVSLADNGVGRARLRASLAGGAAVAVLLAALAPANAGPHSRHEAKKEPKHLQVPLITVSIADQRLTLYDQGKPIAHAPVSTGMAGHATPTGLFSVIQKEVFHRSNIYSGAPMPFMQRITWSGIALHAGVLPGYPASHGCIRMPPEFAVKLYHMTQRGAHVVVARGEAVPVPFDDPHLFTLPKPLADKATALTAPVPFTINPAEIIKTAERQTPAVVSDAGDAAARALASAAKARSNEANGTSNANDAGPATTAATGDVGNSSTGGGTTGVGVVKPVPVTLSQPITTTATFTPTTAPAAAAAAPDAQAMLEPYGPERPLRPGPITVFVSRKEGKVFVRKGFEQILSMPVTIAQPELALGTHMFMATAAKMDGTGFDWLAVSLPGGHAKKARVHHVRDRKGRVEKVVASATPPASTATEALDRITFPPEALARISSLMSPGATLIIADQGLGPETGSDTDFVVLTH